MSFSSFSEDGEAILAEHALIGRKPRLEGAGIGLRSLTLSLFLHQEYCKVDQEVERLSKSRDTFEILPLVWGNGKLEGDFVIASLSIARTQMDDEGNTIAATVSVTLKENAAPDKRDQAQQQAKKNAFAVGDKKTPAKSARTNPSPCEKKASSRVSVIKANSANVDKICRGYTSQSGENSKLLSHLNIIAQNANALHEETITYTSCLFDNSKIKTASTNVKTRADSLRALVQQNAAGFGSSVFTPDIISVKSGNLSLQSAVNSLSTAAAGINKSSITR